MGNGRVRSAVGALRQRLTPRVWICLAAGLAAQGLVYYGTHLLLPYLPSYCPALPLDAMIPLVPEWIVIYSLAFASWAVSAVFILAGEARRAYRMTAAYILAMLLSGAIFLAWPCTMARPEIVGDGLFRNWLRGIYRVDAPVNLCPSLHVLASYILWRGLWGDPRASRAFKGFNGCFFVLVCLSVLFVKQHLAIDIPAAVAVAEVALQAARRLRLERVPMAVAAKLGGAAANAGTIAREGSHKRPD